MVHNSCFPMLPFLLSPSRFVAVRHIFSEINLLNNNQPITSNLSTPSLYTFSTETGQKTPEMTETSNSDNETKPKSPSRGQVVVITSGKGGVGKTTTAANIGLGLAFEGHKVALVDFDCGQRNLDLHLGLEKRIIYDLVQCIENMCTVEQALIKDKRTPNLSMLAASQTRDKTSLTQEGVEKVVEALAKSHDYVVLDSPAGIESGALHALYLADQAIIVVNPEISSISDSDKVIGIIESRSRRAALHSSDPSIEPVERSLIINRYSPERVESDASLQFDVVQDMLGIPLLGVIPENAEDILHSTNRGEPVILGAYLEKYKSPVTSKSGQAYQDAVKRMTGVETPMRFLNVEQKGFFDRFLGRK